ncbi:unnamed protein product [Medioppia subpectinata]|uniref:Uncharacterized protein n=1 Tax=Medioppia subpectinata TaxID=1979941 RepID=A0A7R9KVP2_9ACAR|nr:unnamed protein product [Medioppia subpectinata]CAG2110730.1 unnamed protein product [Medioppia subpectinata]
MNTLSSNSTSPYESTKSFLNSTTNMNSYSRHRFYDMSATGPIIAPNISPFQSVDQTKHYFQSYSPCNVSNPSNDFSHWTFANLQPNYGCGNGSTIGAYSQHHNNFNAATVQSSSSYDPRRNNEILSGSTTSTPLPPLLLDNNAIHQQMRYSSGGY